MIEHTYTRGESSQQVDLTGGGEEVVLYPSSSSICLQCRRPQLDSWVGKIHWQRDRLPIPVFLGFLMAQLVKNLPTMPETWVRSLGWEDPLEKGEGTHSSILAWRIPWTV